MKAGRMRHWLRIERPVLTADTYGAPVKTWESVAEVPVSIDSGGGAGRDNLGREYLGADRELAGIVWRITLRETPGIQIEPNWRGVSLDDDADRIFDFVAVLPSHARDEITIAATSGQSQP